ncbi:putative ribonuclease H protein [Sesbania bispinosa]|nr:putative ribonuclease H protein [Sesbania bispinosa]
MPERQIHGSSMQSTKSRIMFYINLVSQTLCYEEEQNHLTKREWRPETPLYQGAELGTPYSRWRRPKQEKGTRAMMMKLGRGLVNTPDAYRVRVIRSKYQCRDDLIPKISRRPKESLVWRGIRQTWGYILKGSTVGHWRW